MLVTAEDYESARRQRVVKDGKGVDEGVGKRRSASANGIRGKDGDGREEGRLVSRKEVRLEEDVVDAKPYVRDISRGRPAVREVKGEIESVLSRAGEGNGRAVAAPTVRPVGREDGSVNSADARRKRQEPGKQDGPLPRAQPPPVQQSFLPVQEDRAPALSIPAVGNGPAVGGGGGGYLQQHLLKKAVPVGVREHRGSDSGSPDPSSGRYPSASRV